MNDWRDISSAPKDGTEILLGTLKDGRWFHIMSDWWTSRDHGSFWHAWCRYDFNPTHWMPLPSPLHPMNEGNVTKD